MTDKEFEAICKLTGDKLIDLYANLTNSFPKGVIIAGLTGTLAACATEAEIPRETILKMLNSAFDDIEAGDK